MKRFCRLSFYVNPYSQEFEEIAAIFQQDPLKINLFWTAYQSHVLSVKHKQLHRLLTLEPSVLEAEKKNGSLKAELITCDREFSELLSLLNKLGCHSLVVEIYEAFGSDNHLLGESIKE